MSRDNGGPAFPLDTLNPFSDQGRAVDCQYFGLSVRDYFAAHAPETPDMQTFPMLTRYKDEIIDLGNGMKGPRSVGYPESLAERAARWAAEYADAMISERAK